MNKAIRHWLPVFLWMGFIFWMSTETFSARNTSLLIGSLLFFLAPSLSPAEVAAVQGVIRKSGHLIEYAILAMLLFRAFRGGSGERTVRWSLCSLFVVALYAAGDEFHQSFTAARTASLRDVGIDTLGGILALGVSALWRRIDHRR
ncbi:MAG: VanZ family protein [Nitrospirae bacterium]|nr:VanZ family protein [Nitrospirota bacterium]